MSLYRVKQFIWAITANFKPIDNSLINRYLNEEEKQLFNKLNHKDKMHSIRVCNDALITLQNEKIKIDKEKVARAALLHDIGKAELALGVVEKSALVMLNKLTKGKLREYNHIKRVDIYYNHGTKGAKLLKEINNEIFYDKEFLDCIENHHNDESKNRLLKLIKDSDDRN